MVAATASSPPPVYEVTGNTLSLRHFHDGQARVYWSEARTILLLAGTQSGKTVAGPAWLFREMQRRGPGDYLVVSPTFALMEIKVLPELKRFFAGLLDLGDYVSSPIRKFTLNKQGNYRLFGDTETSEETHIYFGYGVDPDSLESATYKAAWLDEAGQKKFKRASFEAIKRRLSIAEGRILITTTPYTLGWLKTELYDRRDDPQADIDVISFPSTANPAFPASEFERARRELPAWKFNMFYRGQFDRPAGMIYGCFDPTINEMPRFAIPQSWPRHLGLDFGGVNTAGLFLAHEHTQDGVPTSRYIAYREYHAGERTAGEHARQLLQHEPRIPHCIGGSKSEGQWRMEFARGGLPVNPPVISDVEVGIDLVYGGFNTGEIVIFDDLLMTLDQIGTYSRPLDERGEPMEGIEDKEAYHLLDGMRYIVGWLRGARAKVAIL